MAPAPASSSCLKLAICRDNGDAEGTSGLRNLRPRYVELRSISSPPSRPVSSVAHGPLACSVGPIRHPGVRLPALVDVRTSRLEKLRRGLGVALREHKIAPLSVEV